MFSEKRQAADYARVLRQVAPGEKNISLMGLVEAPRAFVRGRYRLRLMLQGQRSFEILDFMHAMLANAPKIPSSDRVRIYKNPQSIR
ncbi:hypothetical protein [Bartonella henselae]|uniref:hypothetical protein n=1 Tax=Bartonella henselae TaxID=38323 RepID=UPI00094B3CC2